MKIAWLCFTMGCLTKHSDRSKKGNSSTNNYKLRVERQFSHGVVQHLLMNWTYVYYLHLDTLASPTKRFKGLRNLFTTSFQTRYDFGCRKCNRIRLCFPKVFYFNCSLYRTREGESVPCDNFFLICYQFMSTKKNENILGVHELKSAEF
jgi:hypothetical protein